MRYRRALRSLLNASFQEHRYRHMPSITAGPQSYLKSRTNTLFGTVQNLRKGFGTYHCISDGCTRRAYYGPKEDRLGTLCKLHKDPDHVIMGSIRCQFPGCGVRASFGCPEDRKKLFCSKHQREGDVNLSASRKCRHPGCRVTASFGCPEERQKLLCSKHKREGDVHLASARCRHTGCGVVASFGCPEDKQKLYCSKHKREGDTNLLAMRCQHDGCGLEASYGCPGDRKRLFCGKHKREGDLNLKYVRHGVDSGIPVPKVVAATTTDGSSSDVNFSADDLKHSKSSAGVVEEEAPRKVTPQPQIDPQRGVSRGEGGAEGGGPKAPTTVTVREGGWFQIASSNVFVRRFLLAVSTLLDRCKLWPPKGPFGH